MKSGPRLPQLEKALAQKRRPNTAKKKFKKKKKVVKGESQSQCLEINGGITIRKVYEKGLEV